VKHIWRNHRGGRNPVNSARPEQADDLFEVLNRMQDSLKSKRTSKEKRTRRRTRKTTSSSSLPSTAAATTTTTNLKDRKRTYNRNLNMH